MLHHEMKRLPVTRFTIYIGYSVVYSNVRDVTGKIGMAWMLASSSTE